MPNGLSLRKIHHATFDRNILGVRPNLVVEVCGDILTKKNGPMLPHGLQECHGSTLLVPPRKEDRPGTELVEIRHERFRQAS